MAELTVQRDATPLAPGTAACMGAFDGMHLGHQALLARARAIAAQVAVVTFDPHPMQVLAPNRAPRLLQTPIQRERLAAHFGVDVLVLLPFDRAMAELSPEAFVQTYLVDGLRPTAVVVGEDFRFGADRRGDVQALRELLEPAQIEVHVVEPVPAPDSKDRGPTKLGSTDVRRALDAGEVERAGILLGRWHAVTGQVVQGHRRGRTLGFPTANVDYRDGYLPPIGIYATALVVWDEHGPDSGRVWPSVTSIGRNPTFGDDAPVTLEVYVVDEDLGERLYGAWVEVSFLARLRGEQRFGSAKALVEQIQRDIEQARTHFTPRNIDRVVVPPRR
jgi:riboflavin kinase/FMN adenylyltransferase